MSLERRHRKFAAMNKGRRHRNLPGRVDLLCNVHWWYTARKSVRIFAVVPPGTDISAFFPFPLPPLHPQPTLTMSRANQWFVPGDGIAREVITADIQRYLGPDALVRPGPGTGEYEVCLPSPAHRRDRRLLTRLQGVNGYWITAYRTLTTVCSTPPSCRGRAAG